MPYETYGRNGATPIFRSFYRTASSTSRLESLEHLNVMFIIYIILSTMASCLDLKDAILFYSLIFLYISIIFLLNQGYNKKWLCGVGLELHHCLYPGMS